MSVIVKICGLRDAPSLEAALDHGADMVGFVFFARSPRHISLDRARMLGARVAGRALKVALTVDADDAALSALIDALQPDILQLHGGETPERTATIRQRFGRPVMKAIGLAARADVARVVDYAAVADRLLFDAQPPAAADRPGGNGEAFDWTLLRGLDTGPPWLLAGGLDAGNVAAALRETGAPGVDVSSGVETAPGRKSLDKIARFIEAVRAAAPLGADRQML